MITSHRMPPSSAAFWLRTLGGLCTAAVMLLLQQQAAQAQGQIRLDARYEATLAGIPVGRGGWTIEISDDKFSAAAYGGTAGLLKAFAGGSGTSVSQGRIINGALVHRLCRHHHHLEEIRNHPDGAGQRLCEGIRRSSRNRRSIPAAFPSPTRSITASTIR